MRQFQPTPSDLSGVPPREWSRRLPGMLPVSISLFTLAAVGLLVANQSPPEVRAQALASATGHGPALSFAWQGVASCAAAACHGGSGPPVGQANSYTTWMTRDRHALAYAILFDAKAQRIEQNLAPLRQKVVSAETDSRCLDCHVHPDEGSVRHSEAFARADGVSCESCHGPAEKWLAPHTERGWKSFSDAQKLALGMNPTKNLTVRANVCVGCHVGAPGREVDHDLIAAGHPRLNFEFGSYQANMPKHWDLAADTQRHPDFEARAWAVGQVVSAQAALDLLAARALAVTKQPARVWPEFSEYGCYACHHDLSKPGQRQQRSSPGPALGSLAWGTWYYPMMRALASQLENAELSGRASPLIQLEKLLSDPDPSPAQVQEQAERASALLGNWLHRVVEPMSFDEPTMKKLLKTFADNGQKLQAPSWDESTQLYLALAALTHAQADLGHPVDTDAKADLRQIVSQLKFPSNQDSPKQAELIPGPFGDALKHFADHAGR